MPQFDLLGDNLTAAYALDETAGFARQPIFGGHPFSEINGAVASVADGIIGRAASFAGGTSDVDPHLRVAFADAAAANMVVGDFDFTWTFWLRLNVNNAVQNIAGQAEAGGAVNERGVSFILLNTGVLRITVSADGTSSTNSSADNTTFGALSTGVWYMVTCRFDASANTMYNTINGSTTVTVGASAVHASLAAVTLGTTNSGAGSAQVNGDIDEFCFYKRFLTDDELVAKFNSGAARRPNSSGVFPLTNFQVIVDPEALGGHNYIDLDTALATEEVNLIQLNADFTFLCRGGDLGPCNVPAYGGSPSNPFYGGRTVKIVADPNFHHNKQFATGTNIAYIDATGTNAFTNVGIGYSFEVHGIVVAGGTAVINSPSTGGVTFGQVIVDDVIANEAEAAIGSAGAFAFRSVYRNCIFLDGAVVQRSTDGHTELYNSFVRNTGGDALDFSLGASYLEDNNYTTASGDNYGSGLITKGANSATDNAEALTPALRNIPYNTTTFTNVTPGSEDLTPVTGSSLLDAGADLSGVGVVDDMIGTPRPQGAAYDIGPIELLSEDGLAADNFVLSSSLSGGSVKLTLSCSVKAISASSSAYVRTSLQTLDETINSTLRERRVRGYYSIPPSTFYQSYKARVDFSDTSSMEDGVRALLETFKDGESVIVDGMVAVEAEYGSSFVHPLESRAAETFTFSPMVGLNSVFLEFSWVPRFLGFVDLAANLEIARLEIDVNNALILTLLASSQEREYAPQNVYGGHDPTFRLEKMRGGSVTASVDVVGYCGYDLTDPAVESVDDVITFSLVHLKDTLLALKVDRYGVSGVDSTAADVTAFSGNAEASIVYNGLGYYGQPTLRLSDTGTTNRGSFTVGRSVPLGRSEVMRRTTPLSKPALLGGERDPTGGEITADPFAGDDFNRGDNADLGADWDTLVRTGQGAAIVANAAEISEEGVEVWNRRIGHSDVTLTGLVTINDDAALAGLLARADTTRSGVTAYGAEILQTGASAATLRFVGWYEGTKYVLSSTSLSSYTSGETLRLEFSLTGSTIAIDVFDPVDDSSRATIATTSTVYSRPGLVGIYGLTGGALEVVTVDDFTIAPNFTTGVA